MKTLFVSPAAEADINDILDYSIRHQAAFRRPDSEGREGCRYDVAAGTAPPFAAQSTSGQEMTAAVHSDKVIQQSLLLGGNCVMVVG